MSNIHDDIMNRLKDPFEEDEIEWKVQSAGVSVKNGTAKPWILAAPYVTSRGVQDRLDLVFGLNWGSTIQEVPNQGMLCGLRVKVDGEWIERMDGSEYSQVAAFKGGISGSYKRTGVLFGVGRYLYKIDPQWPVCKIVGSRKDVTAGNYHFIKKNEKKFIKENYHVQWFPPSLPSWALPHVEADELIAEIEKAENVIDLRAAFTNAYNYASSFKRADLAKRMVTIKNAQKIVLEKESKIETEKDEKKHRAWFERKVTEVILKAGNESVLRVQYEAFKKEVVKVSKEKHIDPEPLLDVLNDYNRKQLNKLAIQ